MIIKKVIVACCDSETREIIAEGLRKFLSSENICICKNDNDMAEFSKMNDNPVVIFDKYYLGYVLSYQILRLKFLNEKLLSYFVEIGDCSKYFGLRIFDLGLNGLISQIENKNKLKRELEKVLQGVKTFPDIVMRSIDDNELLLERKSFTEVTEKEMCIGHYLGMGKSQKEISYLTGMSVQAVNLHAHRLRRKIGYKKPMDFTLLSKQDMKGYERNGY